MGGKPSPKKEPSITEEEKPSRWSSSYRTQVRTSQKLSKILGHFEGIFWVKFIFLAKRSTFANNMLNIYGKFMVQRWTFLVHPIICQIFANTVGVICKLDLAVCHESLMYLSHIGHIVLPPGGLKSCPKNSKPFLKYLSNCHVFVKYTCPYLMVL